MNIKITGSGSYIPTKKVTNSDFAQHDFLNEDGTAFNMTNDIIAEKFVEITGIIERRYACDEMVNSDMAFISAKKAIEKQISFVVFDRGNRPYHGRIKAVSEGAREAGLIF